MIAADQRHAGAVGVEQDHGRRGMATEHCRCAHLA